MKIHEVVNNSALQVILNTVDDDLLAHINQFHICQVLFILVDCLINLLIVSYAVPKVQCGGFRVLA